MRVTPAVVDVVNRAYDVEAKTPAWLESVRQAALQSFPDHLTVAAYTFSVSTSGAFHPGEVAIDPLWQEAMQRAHDGAGPPVIRRLYLRGPVQNADQALAKCQDDPGYQQYRRGGYHITLAVGVDPSGNGCALSFMRQDARVLSRPERHTLERIAAHLASAYRMRSSLDERRPAEALLDQADAVLSADGAILHAQGDARDEEARHALRDAARRIDRARMQRRGSSPGDALAMWRALVDGRWSLVERFESDGRRIFVARRNDPASRAIRALSEQERKVAALIAIGHSLKLCAYDLGKAESTISELAHSAMRKLGVRSRAGLVELHGAIVGDKSGPEPFPEN